MRSLLLFLLLLFIPAMTIAKGVDLIDSLNSETFWKGIVFKDLKAESILKKRTTLPTADTIFMVASNRATKFGDVRFMSEKRGTDHINYFLVFLKNGVWNVWHTSFKTAITHLGKKNRDWVVYTEGFGKIFTTGVFRGLGMTSQYNVNVLYLDYPSYNTSKRIMGNYYFALDNAKQSGHDFAPVFDTLKKYKEKGTMGLGKITLFFHSMGNNMIMEMVKNNLIASLNTSKWIDNIILNSACVPEKNHKAWVDQLNFTNQIYVNYNPRDATLTGANFMSLKKQLGQEQKNDRSTKALYVNFNELCNRNHSNFMEMPGRKVIPSAAIAYYNLLFHGHAAEVTDAQQFKANAYNRRDYTILNFVNEKESLTSEVADLPVQNSSIKKPSQKIRYQPASDLVDPANIKDRNTSSMLH